VLVASEGRGPDGTGPLTQTVLDFVQTMSGLVPTARTPADWAPLAPFVEVDDFERVGTLRERQSWSEYLEMLTRWAAATTRFETTVHRMSEVARLVYYEIEERHTRADRVHTVNSLTVFEFTETGKIRRLNVYLQEGR